MTDEQKTQLSLQLDVAIRDSQVAAFVYAKTGFREPAFLARMFSTITALNKVLELQLVINPLDTKPNLTVLKTKTEEQTNG